MGTVLYFIYFCIVVHLASSPLCSFSLVMPPQMSLTLEEKQRLAKEQEQAAKLRSQQPLAPQTVKAPATTNTQVSFRTL